MWSKWLFLHWVNKVARTKVATMKATRTKVETMKVTRTKVATMKAMRIKAEKTPTQAPPLPNQPQIICKFTPTATP